MHRLPVHRPAAALPAPLRPATRREGRRTTAPRPGRVGSLADVRSEAALLLAVGLLMFAGVTALVTSGATRALDLAAVVPLHRETTWVDTIGKITELPGQRAVGYPLALVLLALLARRRRDWQPLAAAVLAMVLVNVLVGASKIAWARPSPRRGGSGVLVLGWDGTLGGYPSGHAANISAMAAVLLLVVLRSGSRRLRQSVVAVTAATVMIVCLTSWLRSTHWVSDLVAGAAAGAACAGAAVVLVGLLPGWRHSRAVGGPLEGG